jgi:hypothetical protein
MHDSNKVDRETTHMKISAEGPAEGPAGESEFLPFFNGPPGPLGPLSSVPSRGKRRNNVFFPGAGVDFTYMHVSGLERSATRDLLGPIILPSAS